MIVDLEMLPWRAAMDILAYCIQNNVEIEKCKRILSTFAHANYILNIPDKHSSFLSIYMSRWNQC